MLRRISFLFLLLFSLTANAVLFTDIKFGNKQMGDSSSWNVGNCVYTTSCTAGNIGNVGSMRNGNGQNFTLGATQYMKFSYTNTVAGEPWTITVYNANGTVATVLGTYRIMIAGEGYFMTSNQPHPNAGNGTLWSTQKGMTSMAPAVTFTGISQPTPAQMDAYANNGYYSPDPITVSGQTYTPPPPPYSSNITAAQTATRAAAQITRDSYSGNNVYIEQVGDSNNISILQASSNNTLKGRAQETAQFIGSNNTIDIRQGAPGVVGKNLIEFDFNGNLNNIKLYQDRADDGSADTLAAGNHIMRVNVSGNSNIVNSRQRNNNGPTGHFMDINITGNSNNISTLQINDMSKTGFVNVNGSSNTVDLYQEGAAGYYADIKLQGNGHNVTLYQTGQAEHKATIDLTNNGAAGTVNVTQQGTTAQVYSIQQSCVSLPCGATITQGQ